MTQKTSTAARIISGGQILNRIFTIKPKTSREAPIGLRVVAARAAPTVISSRLPGGRRTQRAIVERDAWMGTGGPAGAGRRRPRSPSSQGGAARRAFGAGVATLANPTGPPRAAQVRDRPHRRCSRRRGSSRRRTRRAARCGDRPIWRRRGLGRPHAEARRPGRHGLGRDAHERAQDPGHRWRRQQQITAVLRRSPKRGRSSRPIR